MTELAGLLGGPRVTDAEPDPDGHRHERSVRRFGQISVTALHQLGAT
jgi:hypothetical protein